ncbi:MAG TPA: ABC transporter substrate-binding protein [Pseudonocardiaceae bacterium]|jgi:peptide/nickel transport system substrate-binding protein|nr:ABC transporter substrate-binding protein [Pseudonocardiaceae bacterium]
MSRFRKLATVIASGVLLAVCAACGGGSAAEPATGNTLTISNESGSLWSCSFNPFNSSVSYLSIGNVYEPLVFINTLQNAKASPWLASAWAWSNDNKTITFTIRDGVKWSDGQPMTAADVLFTFNELKKFPALDLNSIWSVISSVAQQGSNQVVVNFKTAATPYFYYIGDQLPIIPQHIWSSIADPVHYTDTNPIGTGAYTVNPCKPQNVTFTANKNYWQPGLPKVTTVQYPAFTSNDPANNYLATGQAQWGSQFIPNIDAFYVKKNADHHYWFPPFAQVSLFPNETVGALGDVKVRQALAYATDRQRASTIGEYGYEPAGNQLGVVTPTFSSWISPAEQAANTYTYNPTKADQILESDGYHKGSDGIYVSATGQKLSFTVINIGGYSDWVAALQTVTQGMKAAGIQLTVDNLSSNDYFDKLYNGKFDLAYFNELTTGPTPYYELREWLYSANSAPIGQQATTNYERYNNPATDALFNDYAATTDPATQKQIIGQLENVMLQQVPIIPVTEAVNWYQYDTENFTGWVTPQNQYAMPAAYQYPDMGQMLLHLQPKK